MSENESRKKLSLYFVHQLYLGSMSFVNLAPVPGFYKLYEYGYIQCYNLVTGWRNSKACRMAFTIDAMCILTWKEMYYDFFLPFSFMCISVGLKDVDLSEP